MARLSRRRRIVLGVALAVFAAVAFVAGWALSPPAGSRPLRCTHWHRLPCTVVSGRVLMVSEDNEGGLSNLQLVVAGTRSLSAPLLTVVKIPEWTRPAHLPARMDWVSARGWIFRGGHGEKELHAQALRYAPAVDVILNGRRVRDAGLSAPPSHGTLSR